MKYYQEKHEDERDKLKMFMKMVKKLDLSKNQKKQIHELKYDWKLDKVDLKSDVKKEKIHFHRLMDSDSIPHDDLNNRIESLYKAKAEYKKDKYKFKLDVKSVLSDDQTKKLDMMKEKMKKHHKKDRNDHHKRMKHDGKDDGKMEENDDEGEDGSYF